MQIDRSLSVLPTRYASRQLRQWMGAKIAIADQAALLSTWLWNEEGYFLLDACEALKDHAKVVSAELHDAIGRDGGERYGLDPEYGPVPAHVHEGIRSAGNDLVRALRTAECSADRAAESAADLWRERRDLFGYDVRDQYRSDPRSSPWSQRLESVAKLYFDLPAREEQLRGILADHANALHSLALAESARKAHLDMDDSITTEGRYLRGIFGGLRRHRFEVAREEEAALRMASARFQCPAGDQVPSETAEAHAKATKQLTERLAGERELADLEIGRCSELWSSLEEAFGLVPGTRQHIPPDSPAQMEAAASLSYRLNVAQARLADMLPDHGGACHAIAHNEDRRIAYVRSGVGTRWADLRNLHHREFEQLVAKLLERDGFTVLQHRGGPGDLGADVIAVSPSGQRVVLQCKLSSKLNKVDTGILQRFNGTAKPEHRADVAVLVTNASFTKPALRFAHSHGIKLLGGWEMQRWAQWGIPASSLLRLR